MHIHPMHANHHTTAEQPPSRHLDAEPPAPTTKRVTWSEAGERYLVDVEDGVCSCPDSTHRGVTCKHTLAARYWLGDRSVPAWVQTDAVDELLLEANRAAARGDGR